MLIPGLPMVGAQQDVVKPKRQVQPTAESERVHEAIAEAGERRRRDEGHYPERRRNRARRQPVDDLEPISELRSKGLLVDIQV